MSPGFVLGGMRPAALGMSVMSAKGPPALPLLECLRWGWISVIGEGIVGVWAVCAKFSGLRSAGVWVSMERDDVAGFGAKIIVSCSHKSLWKGVESVSWGWLFGVSE
eukprot:scaffold233982_cov52-Attheya_sp.AAC.1